MSTYSEEQVEQMARKIWTERLRQPEETFREAYEATKPAILKAEADSDAMNQRTHDRFLPHQASSHWGEVSLGREKMYEDHRVAVERATIAALNPHTAFAKMQAETKAQRAKEAAENAAKVAAEKRAATKAKFKEVARGRYLDNGGDPVQFETEFETTMWPRHLADATKESLSEMEQARTRNARRMRRLA